MIIWVISVRVRLADLRHRRDSYGIGRGVGDCGEEIAAHVEHVPRVCNDNVIEGVVALAKAGEADFEDHDERIGVLYLPSPTGIAVSRFGRGFSGNGESRVRCQGFPLRMRPC